MAVKPLSARTRESAIEQYLVDRVRALGGRCEKVTVLGTRGFFDRLVVLPGGRIIFVELKRPTGGVWALHQKRFAQDYRALGATVALARNLADVDRLLEGTDTPPPGREKAGSAQTLPASTRPTTPATKVKRRAL